MNNIILKSKWRKAAMGLLIILVLSGIAGITSRAQTEKRAANIKSKGIFDYENGTVVMDASDLTYLADEIDLLENVYKSETTDSLNEIGMFFRSDGTATHNADESLINSTNKNTSLLTFAQINDAIRQSQSVENAPTAAEIINGKSAYANGIKINGTMPDNGATGKSNLTAGSSYTIPAGYTTGGTVKAASLESQTPATATAANIIQGKTAWVNGVKIAGTMPDNGATGKSNLAAGSSYTIPAGYTTGGTVKAASLESQTPATATAANITQGKTAWVNGVKITGTGADNQSQLEKSELHKDSEYTIQHTGTAVITYYMYTRENYDCNKNVSLPGFDITLGGATIFSEHLWVDYAARDEDIGNILCFKTMNVTAGQKLKISCNEGFLCNTGFGGSIVVVY